MKSEFNLGTEIKNMAFFCKRKVSKSKRKTIGCKGCKYYEKVFWNNHWQWRCTCQLTSMSSIPIMAMIHSNKLAFHQKRESGEN